MAFRGSTIQIISISALLMALFLHHITFFLKRLQVLVYEYATHLHTDLELGQQIEQWKEMWGKGECFEGAVLVEGRLSAALVNT